MFPFLPLDDDEEGDEDVDAEEDDFEGADDDGLDDVRVGDGAEVVGAEEVGAEEVGEDAPVAELEVVRLDDGRAVGAVETCGDVELVAVADDVVPRVLAPAELLAVDGDGCAVTGGSSPVR